MAGYRLGEMVRDRYEIKACLGIGRLGTALRVLDHEAGAEVALKVLHPFLVPDDDAGARLMAGLRGLRGVKHPAFARIHDANCEGSRTYYTRQLLDGTPLARLLAGRRARGHLFTAREAYPVIAQIAALLSGGLVHGSLCPDDIWILPEQLKVTDAGLAVLLFGEPLSRAIAAVPRYAGYTAPEVVAGLAPDPRSDVFALGALLGELLTPLQADGRGRTFREHDPELPAELAEIIEKAMQQRPQRRYPEPAAFVASLEEVIGTPGSASSRAEDTVVDAPPTHDTEPSPPPVELLDDDEPIHLVSEAPEVTAQAAMDDIIEDHEARRAALATPPPLRPERPTRPAASALAARHSSEPPPPPPKAFAPPVKLARVILAGTTEGTARLGPKRPTPVPPRRASATDVDPALLADTATRDVTEELDVSLLEPMAPSQAGAAASKLENEARVAKQRTTEELLRRSAKLEGIDPRLVRAAHTIESEKVSGGSAQAASILRQRAEQDDLDGIDPRLLRAAARLETARISSIPAPDAAEPDDPDAWREEIASLKQDQVISFLSPPVSAKQSEVTGFPRNQKRSPAAHAPPSTQRGKGPATPIAPPPKKRGS